MAMPFAMQRIPEDEKDLGTNSRSAEEVTQIRICRVQQRLYGFVFRQAPIDVNIFRRSGDIAKTKFQRKSALQKPLIRCHGMKPRKEPFEGNPLAQSPDLDLVLNRLRFQPFFKCGPKSLCRLVPH